MAKNIVIVGGGAAGYFLACNIQKSSHYNVILLEKSAQSLQKVKVSGGGRCNLTHAEFDPKELVQNYPRGSKELLSVFSKFQPSDTFEWFASKGLELKIEKDMRVFPVSDSSQTVIDVFQQTAAENGVLINHKESLQSIIKVENGFEVITSENTYHAYFLCITTGSSQAIWNIIERDVKHTIIPPLPSLFTFNSENALLKDMAGTSVPFASVAIPALKMEESGPLMITHWGVGGPAILKLSAFAARKLADCNYQFNLHINWLDDSLSSTIEALTAFRNKHPNQKISNSSPFAAISKKFWLKIISEIKTLNPNENWQHLSKQDIERIAEILTHTCIAINGKSTNKAEFVTAGGVSLKEVQMKNMESKLHPNLFFAGEVLNIDGITGGFNFQACWSEAWVIADYLNLKNP